MSLYYHERCTCSGPVEGWPQHEAFCGQPDPGGPYYIDPSILETHKDAA